MTEIRQVVQTQIGPALDPLYERLLASLANASLGAAVRGCVEAVTTGVRRVYLFEAAGPDEDALCYCHCEPHIAGLLPAYASRFKRLDPLREIYRSAPTPGAMAIQRIRPADIPSSSFRRRFFDEPGIVERVSIVQRAADHWRGINLSRHVSLGPFSAPEIDNLIGLARLALPMICHSRRAAPVGTGLSVMELEERFARRCTALTPRERQVCARAALGMGVEATALDLGIAKTSVVTLRQRAYRRLQVTSANELLGLVAH